MKPAKHKQLRFRIKYTVGGDHATFFAEVHAATIHEACDVLRRANPQRDIRPLSVVPVGRG